MSFHWLGSRFLHGRTGDFPTTCSSPVCDRTTKAYWALRVSQGPRRWTFCDADCLSVVAQLSGLADVHADELVEMAWEDERPR